MGDLLSDKVFIARILGVDGDCAIAKHRFETGGGNFNEAGGVFGKRVFEVHDDTELYFLVIPRNLEKGSFFNISVLYFDIRNGSF